MVSPEQSPAAAEGKKEGPVTEAESRQPEDDAIEWPPRVYREWVQTNIANRMLLQLGGIGIGTLVILSGSYFSLQNFVLDSIRPGIIEEAVKQAVAEAERQIPGTVAQTLLNESQLLEDLRDEALKSDSEVISGIVNSSEFATAATQILIERLEAEGGPQRIILNEGLKMALEEGESEATRALGLELYALFHAGERTSDDIAPMRSMFAEIAAAGTADNPVPNKLLRAILEHYPIGEHDPDEGGQECAGTDNPCLGWDRVVMESMLLTLDNGFDYPVSAELYQAFFSRLPPQLVERVINWCRDHGGKPIARELLASLAKSENAETLANAVSSIAEFTAGTGNSVVRPEALWALSQMSADAELDITVREQALKRIWQGASLDERRLAFSAGSFRELTSRSEGRPPVMDEIYRQIRLEQWESEDSFATAGVIPTTSPLLLASVVKMLRTADSDDGSNAASSAVNDWEYVLRASLSDGTDGALSSLAYAAWALRIAVDSEAGKGVSWSTNKILENPPSGLLTDGLANAVTAFAIRANPSPVTEEFGSYYRAAWANRGDGDKLSMDTISAIIEKDGEADEPYGWLDRALNTAWQSAQSAEEGQFRDHLLDALGADAAAAKSNKLRLRGAARRANETLSNSDGHWRLAEIIIQELARRSAIADQYWDVVSAMEDSGLFSAETSRLIGGEAGVAGLLADVNERMRWAGTRAAVPALFVGTETQETLTIVPVSAPLPAEGGRWFNLDVTGGLFVTIEGLPAGVEAVFMNAGRSVAIGRSTGDGDVGFIRNYLETASYSLAIRDFRPPQDRAEFNLLLWAEEAPVPITVATVETPIEVDQPGRFLFQNGEQAGEGWLLTTLDEGEELIVETSYWNDDAFEVDTIVTLYDGETGIELAYNDDGPEGVYSLVSYLAPQDQEVLIKISECCEFPFAPETTFLIYVDKYDG